MGEFAKDIIHRPHHDVKKCPKSDHHNDSLHEKVAKCSRNQAIGKAPYPLRKIRQAITGDPHKRIRDSMSNKRVQRLIRKVDAMSFSLGVCLILLTEWVFFGRPKMFPYFYIAMLIPMIIYRFYTYRSENAHYFLIDGCYFFTISCWLHILTCGPFDGRHKDDNSCTVWFQANYVMSNGPILLAVFLWNNSLVFHSLDKITSFYIHIMPALTYFLIRWDDPIYSQSMELSLDIILELQLVIFILWSVLYLFIETVWLKYSPEYITSMRFLMIQKMGPTKKMWEKLGIFPKNSGKGDTTLQNADTVDPMALETNRENGGFEIPTAKNVLYFALFQYFLYFVTVTPVALFFYRSYLANMTLMFGTIFIGIWNGANYYIQIFSHRYNFKFVADNKSMDNNNNNNKEA